MSKDRCISKIKKVKIFFCRFPLNMHYNLSYGNIDRYDTIFLEIADEKGKKGFGEVTFLQGYSLENSEESIKWALKISKNILNKDIDESLHLIRKYKEERSFLCTAFSTAIEYLTNQYTYKEIKVPIIGLINEQKENNIKFKVQNLMEKGYRVVKLKTKKETFKTDIKRIQLINKYSKGDLKIRLDANQSLDELNIDYIVEKISPLNLQLLEQPFKRKKLEKHRKLNKKLSFPTMLDESIWKIEDIYEAYHQSYCDFIKLKLQKCGSITIFKEMIEKAKELNLKIIIGNGVQTDFNCINEARIFKKCRLSEVAENIGFQKMNMAVTKNDIKTKNGHMIVKDKPFKFNLKNIKPYIKYKRDIEN